MKTHSDIYALCYCEQFDFPALQARFLKDWRHAMFRNTIHINWRQGDIFILDYGVVVFWNLNIANRIEFLEYISEYATVLQTDTIDDEFTYETGAESRSIKDDHICLPDNEVITKVAICHVIAQSTKLSLFEHRIQDTVNNTAYIPKNIAATGSSCLRRKELAQLRGRLFIAKSDIMLKYDLLDVPDFFWEYPELDGYYVMLSDYLEIKQRVDVLNKKLETIHELLEMISDEQKHKHSSMLEWIIIWLIAFEIIVFIVHDILAIF